ncbi:MAG: ribonuclease Z [Acidobacteriota bacterium]
MRLTVLGSGTLVPSLRRQPSGYLVEAGEQRILLDCGSGTLRRLLESGSCADQLDLILISHTHIDHISELPLLLFSAHYSPCPRQRPLRLAGSTGFAEFFSALETFYGEAVDARHYERQVEVLAAGDGLEAGSARIRTAAARHTASSLAFRIEQGGCSLVYTGDTEYCEDLVRLARGCDLLLCECSFPDESPAAGHLTPSQAGRIAGEAGARKLMLTHFYPACEAIDLAAQVRRAYEGDLVLAEDLLQVSVGAAP